MSDSLSSLESELSTSNLFQQMNNESMNYGDALEFVFKLCHLWTVKNPENTGDICSSDIRFHSIDASFQGLEMLEKLMQFWHDFFDNISYEIQDVFIQGTLIDGKICYITKFFGDWTKPMFGVGPSNKREMYASTIVVLVKNKKVEYMELYNDFSSARELLRAIDAGGQLFPGRK